MSRNSLFLDIHGARVHNLKNISVRIPRNKLVVITGPSGSGKSSLSFDTIFAEGQRRYIETFSAYARHFIASLERPDVDRITGLSPVISIEQKSVNRNPRSTVGTITEIYDFMRLLFARASDAYSHVTGKKMVQYSEKEIIEIILSRFAGKRIRVFAPIVQGRKGHYQEMFEQFRRKGFLYVRINGEMTELKYGLKTDRYKSHFIDLLIDKLVVADHEHDRIRESVSLAMKQGKGICCINDMDNESDSFFSRYLMCPDSGISYNAPAPHTFSFNSPHGACPQCNGLGYVNEADISKVIPDRNISIAAGAIQPLGKYRSSLIFWQLEAIADKFGFRLSDPVKEIPDEAMQIILFGSDETFRLTRSPLGNTSSYFMAFNGIINYVISQQEENNGKRSQQWSNLYVSRKQCPACNGSRLKPESLYFKVAGRNIAELSAMTLSELKEWFAAAGSEMTPRQLAISKDILKEINARIGFLLDVGVDYLTLNRSADTLSGGESQRIRLATQIGSKLVNVLYILDEPSIGLHQHDNIKLIHALKKLRDTGNSVIVVEHDRQTIMESDFVVDMGPYAGMKGGEVVAAGTPEEISKQDTLTGRFLSNPKQLPIPEKRRKGNGNQLVISGASGNNLKNITVTFPMGTMICVTGMSGSGKSTLIKQTLYPLLASRLHRAALTPLPYASVSGMEHIDKVIEVDQSPIGRTPRSNPLTYTNVFNDIRKLFEELTDSKVRGFKAGRFSFNVKGGRCETCRGSGVMTIEMNFLPDVFVTCPDCNGKRYNNETLQVKYQGKTIHDILEMTFNKGVEFFENIPQIRKKLAVVQEVGLGYLKLGQPSTTLSGGEAQRIKIATELMKKDTGNTFYIFDEPTTGLHYNDILVLLNTLNKLTEKGNTIVIIEHNLDVIKYADYVIDLGPEGGKRGGMLVVQGSPEKVSKNEDSITGKYLAAELYGVYDVKTNN